jgi:hypothetical protein
VATAWTSLSTSCSASSTPGLLAAPTNEPPAPPAPREPLVDAVVLPHSLFCSRGSVLLRCFVGVALLTFLNVTVLSKIFSSINCRVSE